LTCTPATDDRDAVARKYQRLCVADRRLLLKGPPQLLLDVRGAAAVDDADAAAGEGESGGFAVRGLLLNGLPSRSRSSSA